MGLYGALRGLTAAARIVRGVQLTGTAVKIKRKGDKMVDRYQRMIRKNDRKGSQKPAKGTNSGNARFRANTMAGQYIASLSKQSRG